MLCLYCLFPNSFSGCSDIRTMPFLWRFFDLETVLEFTAFKNEYHVNSPTVFNCFVILLARPQEYVKGYGPPAGWREGVQYTTSSIFCSKLPGSPWKEKPTNLVLPRPKPTWNGYLKLGPTYWYMCYIDDHRQFKQSYSIKYQFFLLRFLKSFCRFLFIPHLILFSLYSLLELDLPKHLFGPTGP